MEPLHARYPFFESAREAVRAADVSLPALVASDDPAVERGRERVERALLSGEVAPEDGTRWSTREELLSYPVARILVSLLDEPRAVEKYATAEAATAAERFEADFAADDDGLRSTTDVSVDLDTVLREFDLTGQVRPEATGRAAGRGSAWYRVAVGSYLALSEGEWGEGWRLVNRELHDGEVRVQRAELGDLLREATRRRVAAGLPFELDADTEATLRESLTDELAGLRSLLGEREDVGRVDAVIPDLFPEVIDDLLEAAAERDLDAVEEFTLLSFLAAIGMDADDAVAFCRETTLSEQGIRYVMERVADDRGAQYPPPSYETLAAHGVATGDASASGPLAAYRLRVAETPPEDREDWRAREEPA